jgi:formylglycine-generating enzyme required for sulfatase activity
VLTFAISLPPLASACQRTQAAALLTLRPPLADCAGQGAAYLLGNVWGWQTSQGHRGWPEPSIQPAPTDKAAPAALPLRVKPRFRGDLRILDGG